ncbi:endonuclease/exonuclease/phosphatase family protein [Fodinicola acaciae]|uniref:endonuclease/exonuclease/phosphatase family protein n=1 Tax=Fodinicola acaciae TaxID=2681555 RepID=UPI0013D6E094|nr:endonuclease/exonuclease/phosphatase family protein [Fodinicola acaciae]
MLSILTVNIGAAARQRAEALLGWLAARPEDVFVLTETSGGPGTAYLLEQFRAAGFAVAYAADSSGDRGTAVVSRVKVERTLDELTSGVSLPGRVAGVELATTPRTAVLGVYVPSRDRSVDKIEKKERFISSLLAGLDKLPDELRERLVVGGDYNVIARDHQPLHAGFLPFEFGLLETLESHGFVDAYARCSPGEQAYSWIGRTNDGYRYDYFHVGAKLGGSIAGCAYLHETREQRLTDHAAVTLSLEIAKVERLETSDPTAAGDGLF